MKIYVTYKFLTKEDRDAFYSAIKENRIQEYLYLMKDVSNIFIHLKMILFFICEKNGHLKTYS